MDTKELNNALQTELLVHKELVERIEREEELLRLATNQPFDRTAASEFMLESMSSTIDSLLQANKFLENNDTNDKKFLAPEFGKKIAKQVKKAYEKSDCTHPKVDQIRIKFGDLAS